MMSEEIKSIKKWFELAKPNPSIEDVCVQIGCGYEETAERSKALWNIKLKYEIEKVADSYKRQDEVAIASVEGMTREEKIELLDSMCDEIVTRIGEAYMLGFDIEGALNEVNNSNYSKFEDGKPVFNEQGKIAKGKDYFSPKLEKFI